MHICAGIEYDNGPVHSDLCTERVTEDWCALLHTALDEWLRKSNGTGLFFVGTAVKGNHGRS